VRLARDDIAGAAEDSEPEVDLDPGVNLQSRFGNGLVGMPPAGIEPAHAV